MKVVGICQFGEFHAVLAEDEKRAFHGGRAEDGGDFCPRGGGLGGYDGAVDISGEGVDGAAGYAETC